MKIDFLINHPEKVREVSQMVFDEFVVGTNSTMNFEDVLSYFSNTKEDTFPITLIALENGICLGTVSIFENDLKVREMYKPWLASLYTKPVYRGKGIGEKLINKTIDVVRGLGFNELYLRTEDAADYYKDRGWVYVESLSDDTYEKIDVFKMSCK